MSLAVSTQNEAGASQIEASVVQEIIAEEEHVSPPVVLKQRLAPALESDALAAVSVTSPLKLLDFDRLIVALFDFPPEPGPTMMRFIALMLKNGAGLSFKKVTTQLS